MIATIGNKFSRLIPFDFSIKLAAVFLGGFSGGFDEGLRLG